MRVLIIGYVWPESNSSAAGSRMMQLLHFFKATASSVTFATTASPSHYMDDLEGIKVNTVKIELNKSSFDHFLQDLQPQIVVYDRFMMEEQFGWRVEKYCTGALRILDTEDLHFLRNYREKQFKHPGLDSSMKQSELAKREIASIFRCDLSLIISEVEMHLLKDNFQIPEKLLFYLPFLYEELSPEYLAALPTFDFRKNFICIGNFKHAPNVDAVIFLKESIWPLIHKELPEVQMHVYGAYPSARIDQLNQPQQNFYIKGRAADASSEVRKARVCLAPLRFGAGLKGKLTEAMICGTPSVTTGIGAEGIPGEFSWNGYVVETPETFAFAAKELYTSEVKWKKACDNGFRIINSRFSKNLFLESFQLKIKDLQDNLLKHRQENFTGTMLMHHRVKSTYFLSKYIEMKTELEKLKTTLLPK